MHSHGWGGEGKSLRDYKKPIRMPGLAQVIGAAECKKMGSCAIEAAASRHPFLVSFVSGGEGAILSPDRTIALVSRIV